MRVRSLFPSMVLFRSFILLAALTCFLPAAFAQVAKQEGAPPIVEKIDPVKILAQRAALNALTGENPFILRESGWRGEVEPGEARLVQIQLFRRNEYQFWLAMGDRDAELNLNIYDSDGKMVESEAVVFDETNVLSTRFKPELTGVYYVRVSLKTTIDEPQKWSMIYAYR